MVVKTDLIVKDRVEADILEVGRLLNLPQVAPIAFPEAKDGPAGAEHPLPIMREGASGRLRVNGDRLSLMRGSHLPDERRLPRNREQEGQIQACCERA